MIVLVDVVGVVVLVGADVTETVLEEDVDVFKMVSSIQGEAYAKGFLTF